MIIFLQITRCLNQTTRRRTWRAATSQRCTPVTARAARKPASTKARGIVWRGRGSCWHDTRRVRTSRRRLRTRGRKVRTQIPKKSPGDSMDCIKGWLEIETAKLHARNALSTSGGQEGWHTTPGCARQKESRELCCYIYTVLLQMSAVGSDTCFKVKGSPSQTVHLIFGIWCSKSVKYPID